MKKPKEMIILDTADGCDEAFAKLGSSVLALDTETSGLNWRTERVGTINLAAGHTAICALRDAVPKAARYVRDQIRRRRTFVFHNAKFDMHMLRETFGLHFPYPVHDTAVESFVIDNRGANAFGWRTKSPHSLKPLATTYIDRQAGSHEEQLMEAIKRRGGKDKGDWAILLGTEDEPLFTKYSALDPWYTLELHRQFYPRICNWAQPDNGKEAPFPSLLSVYEREQWVLLAFRDMEARGIKTSRRFLEQWRDELKLDLEKQRARLIKVAGKEINWNSWQQLQKLLYEDMGLDGGPKTDAVALLNLSHSIGPLLVKYRETFKQWSSYANSLLEALTPNGLIHCTLKSTGANTGRSSCSDPNLQQQTRVSGVRRAYRPRKGLVFRFADYSQVEMRFAAHFANERSLIEGFINDPDFDTHGSAASRMFGKLYDPESQHRKFAKIINFTKLFGGGENKVTEQLINLIDEKEARAGCRAFKESIPPGLTPWRVLARCIIARFNESMPKLTGIIRSEAKAAEKRGYMMNAFGGHRFFDEGDDRWYAAFNTKVQGTAGIKAKEGLVNVYRECQLNRGELALLLIIHDELVYESEGDPATDRRVLRLMRDLKSYKVPIIADMSGASDNWQNKVKIKL